jgi:hypothetical protein
MRSLIILCSECGDLLGCSVYESYTMFRMWRTIGLFSKRRLIVLRVCSTQSTCQCELPWCQGTSLMHNRLVGRATQITSLRPRTSHDAQHSRGTISSRSLSANHIKACCCDFISSAVPPKSMTAVLVVLPFNTITLADIYDNRPFANVENS